MRPGGPPPWPVHPHDGDVPVVSVDDVRRAVAALGIADSAGAEGDAAVLAPVFEDDGQARVILTRRTEWLRSHSHQVAFPGGRIEPGETLVEAALREAWEEVELDPRAVEVIGGLTPLATISAPGSGIHPFVGILAERPTLVPNPDEVERVFEVAIVELMEEGCYREELWGVPGTERDIHFFELDGETVWGATARMLVELLALITGATRERRSRPAEL